MGFVSFVQAYTPSSSNYSSLALILHFARYSTGVISEVYALHKKFVSAAWMLLVLFLDTCNGTCIEEKWDLKKEKKHLGLVNQFQ